MTRPQAQLLVRAIKKEFGGKAEFEAVNGKGRYRFAITSKQFERMGHLERQDAIWEIVHNALPREATLDVSMILAFAPSDLAVAK
jgi:hypothetical protein